MAAPRFIIGLIGGSGLLKSTLPALQNLKKEFVDTSHGRVLLHEGDIAPGVKLVFVQRHDARPARTYTQPADINYAAVALALAAKGCHFAVGICSVGSLKPSIVLGSLVVPDDFYCPFDLRRVYTDARAHLMPGFDEKLRTAVLEIVRSIGCHPLSHGTYVNARGPRFETKSEIRHFATVGDIVGMTSAHECAACNEVGIPYAILCMVDNYANGVQGPLTLEMFHKAQSDNLVVVERCVEALLRQLGSRTELVRTPPAISRPPAAEGATGTPQALQKQKSPTPVDLLVNARYIVPMAPGKEEEVLSHHSIAVRDGKILGILPTPEAVAEYSPISTVDLAGGHVVMPGLVNAHTHAAMNLLKGVADDLPLLQWLTEQIWPTEARLVSPEFVAAGCRAAVAELIKGGVTCLNDMYFHPAASAAVYEQAGIRGNVALVVLEFPSSYAADASQYLEKGVAVLEDFAARAVPNVRFTLGPHAPYTVSDATFEKIRDLSAHYRLPVHVHLHETAGEVDCSRQGQPGPSRHLSEYHCTPIDNLDRIGLLNERLIAVHMTCLTDDEIARLSTAKSSVVHCPTSNLKLASGFCPVARLLKAGVNVALGTDGSSSNNGLDMFAEMKLAALLAKGVASDATAVPAAQALRMATYNGAKALGLEGQTGSLEPGKWADMVAVDLSGTDQQPLYNVISQLVYACNRTAVTDVWVGGQQLLADRCLTTLDEVAIKKELLDWAEKVRPGKQAADS